MPNLFAPSAMREIVRRWERMTVDASPRVADHFLRAVMETAEMLQGFPLAGTPSPLPSPRLTTLRRFPIALPFGRWLMLYTVQGEDILVLRVIHASQDWTRIFRVRP